MPLTAKEVLSDILIISAEEIALSGSRTLEDLLQQKRGFEITRYGGAGSAASVFIRGTGNTQSLVLIDGVRVESSTLGGATWSSIPLSQIDHVEVVFGPQSSMYGADAMGGVVQIFTRQGEGAPNATVTTGVGSAGLRLLEAGVSGATADAHKIHYAIQAASERMAGFSAAKPGAGPYTYNADNDGYKKSSLSTRLGMTLAEGHTLGVQFLNSRVDAQFDAGAGFDDRTEQRLSSVALVSQNQLAANWRSVLQIGQTTDQSKTFASYGNDFINSRQNQFSWQSDITFDKDVLQVVMERRVEHVDADTAQIRGDRSTNSVAASYHLRRGAQRGSIAVREDDNSQFGRHFTTSAEYGYRIDTSWRFNASAGTSFRAPTFNELYYPGYGIANNKPEQGRNRELGLYYDQGERQVSAVLFQNRLSDLLVYAPVCPVLLASHPYGCAYNIDSALLRGLSLSAEEQIGSIRLRAALDLQDPRNQTSGKTLARRAKQHGSLGAEYALGDMKLGLETIFSSQRFDDADNLQRLGGYTLFNLLASQRLGANWTLFGRWNNVTNKNYELAQFYATPGSNVFVGLRYAMR